MKKLSLVIPCYNESSPLRDTYKEIKRVLETSEVSDSYNYEMIFVNDGSTDDTINIIQELAALDNTVKYVSFTRNFGKESGMLAGLNYASGDIVIIIDADLQHPPHLIPEMIYSYEEGYDQVIARRSRKGEKFARKWATKTYYSVIKKD